MAEVATPKFMVTDWDEDDGNPIARIFARRLHNAPIQVGWLSWSGEQWTFSGCDHRHRDASYLADILVDPVAESEFLEGRIKNAAADTAVGEALEQERRGRLATFVEETRSIAILGAKIEAAKWWPTFEEQYIVPEGCTGRISDEAAGGIIHDTDCQVHDGFVDLSPSSDIASTGWMRNYKAMTNDNLLDAIRDLERGFGPGHKRVLEKGGDVGANFRSARSFARQRGLIP